MRGTGGCRNWSCNHLGETAPLFCCINLLFSRSPARSFDPLLDHPLDDSLTAKEIKYIRLTTSPPNPSSPVSPSSLLLPEASISSIDKQQIRSLSLQSPSPSFSPFFPSSLVFCFSSMLYLIPALRWMHVRDVISLFNMFS